jgi:hypothetical protein
MKIDVNDYKTKTKQSNDASDLRSHRILRMSSGRIRPFVLALIILIAGLLLDKWWWHVGVVIMIVLFVEAFYHYRPLD